MSGSAVECGPIYCHLSLPAQEPLLASSGVCAFGRRPTCSPPPFRAGMSEILGERGRECGCAGSRRACRQLLRPISSLLEHFQTHRRERWSHVGLWVTYVWVQLTLCSSPTTSNEPLWKLRNVNFLGFWSWVHCLSPKLLSLGLRTD